jgi:beta-glucanase (GH16 family)
MNHLLSRVAIILILMLAGQTLLLAQNKTFQPGAVWKDTQGNPINAHGGGLLYHNGTYYWYGEIKKGKTTKVPNSNWENFRVIAGGVSCYSSKDLLNWKNEGAALPSVRNDSTSDIYEGNVIERPKVIYNARTKKFVMWMHIDSKDYAAAKSGVAVSDNPKGPFKYIRSERPNGNMARDMTIYQDEDGKAYHFYSSEENATMHICALSDDYLSHTTNDKRILIGLSREAPAVFKYNKKYYLISSACTGWAPNEASYAVSDGIMGDWQQYGNPCQGPEANKTFFAQSTYVLPINAAKGQFIFLADRWNKTNLEDSRYIWLPLTMNSNTPEIPWYDSWTKVNLNTVGTIGTRSNANSHSDANASAPKGYKLVWADEFNKDGAPDPAVWSYEEGFVRNHEDQWYQRENAYCKDGILTLEARREQKPNPNYVEGSNDWRKSRKNIEYTSASIITRGKKQWLYGRWELRARIDVSPGMWPAWWALGVDKPWPLNGEIDMMEYYRGMLLANIAIGTSTPYKAYWFSPRKPVDSSWASKFHTWRMDWDSAGIALYCDDNLLNKVPMDSLANRDGSGYYPFKHPQYMLFDFALGGDNGGDPSGTSYPRKFEVDYVRIYQKK